MLVRLEFYLMKVVFLSKKLKSDEKTEAKNILNKYSTSIKYAKSINDQNLDLSIMAKNEVLLYHEYQQLTITLVCLRQMDLKSIDPFTFQPRNVGLRNIFLLNRTISLYNAKNPECLKNLIICMGGNINTTPNPNNAELILSDDKIPSEAFSIPLVSSSWIYCISNSSVLAPYQKYLIKNQNEKQSTQNETAIIQKVQTRKSSTQNEKSQSSALQLISLDSCFDITQPPKYVHLTKKTQQSKQKKKNNLRSGSSISQCTLQNAILRSPPNQKKPIKPESNQILLLQSNEKEEEQQNLSSQDKSLRLNTFDCQENQMSTINNYQPIEKLSITTAMKLLTNSCKKTAVPFPHCDDQEIDIESLMKFSQQTVCPENSQREFTITYESQNPINNNQLHQEFSQDPLLALLGD